jgi:hypothetical protein
MFEIAIIKKISKNLKGYTLVDLLFDGLTWKKIRLYQISGFKMQVQVGKECIVIKDDSNISESQMVAFYLGEIEKIKFEVNKTDILKQISDYIAITLKHLDISKASNTANISAFNAQIAINNLISAATIPPVTPAITPYNAIITTQVNLITAENAKIILEKLNLQTIKTKIDNAILV